MPKRSPRRASRAAPSSARASGTVSALRRGLEVLHCFEQEARALSNTEIAQRTGIPKPTVTRLVATLVSLGYLRPASDGDRHLLGPTLVSLSNTFLATLDVRACARPQMQALAASTDGNVYLAVPDRTDMVVIESARPAAGGLIQRLSVGSRVPMSTSALGRAWLASLDAERRDELMPQLRADAPRSWAKLEAAIGKAVDDLRSRGYCESPDLFPDIRTVAIPLAAPNGETLALSCGGPSFVFTEERLHAAVAPRLLEAAQAISLSVGGPPLASNVQPGARSASAVLKSSKGRRIP